MRDACGRSREHVADGASMGMIIGHSSDFGSFCKKTIDRSNKRGSVPC